MNARTATALDDEMRLDHGSVDQLFVAALDGPCGVD